MQFCKILYIIKYIYFILFYFIYYYIIKINSSIKAGTNLKGYDKLKNLEEL